MRIQGLVISAVCAAMLIAAPSHAQAPSGVPGMPPEIETLFRATNNEINGDTRCEVIDWAANPANGMPQAAVAMAGRFVDICVLPHDDLTPEMAAQRLGALTLSLHVENGVFTVLAKTSAPQAFVCCAPQMNLVRLGRSDYWVGRRRLADAEHAMLSLSLMEGRGSEPDWKTWRGPAAPSVPDETEMGQWKGQVIDGELRSASLGETRKLAIYLPPGHARNRSWPALFMTDGGAIEFAGLVEKMVEAGEIPPMIIVSAEAGEDAIVGKRPTQYGDDLRSADYLRRWPQGGDRFDRHMEFFSKELVDYAIAEFGVSVDRKDRVVAGKSSGGVFAFWAGALKPDAFAHAISMSPGYLILEDGDLAPKGDRAAIHVSGGRYEPAFIAAARRAETLLRSTGYDVVARYYSAGHYHDQWAVALRAALTEIFPPP